MKIYSPENLSGFISSLARRKKNYSPSSHAWIEREGEREKKGEKVIDNFRITTCIYLPTNNIVFNMQNEFLVGENFVRAKGKMVCERRHDILNNLARKFLPKTGFKV